MATQAIAELGDLRHDFPSALARLEEKGIASRLWRRDVSLWTDVPAEAEEAARRLGWLELPDSMLSRVDELRAFADEVRRDGFRHAVVLGMGGSSLAPDVFRRMLPPSGGMQLHVLDSTDPESVDRVGRSVPPAETLYLVSSKSGTTTEPLALLEYFWAATESSVARAPGRHFVAITDPGTSLQALAEKRGFRRLFAGPADVGGRYSALSTFGLVPAALLGADLGAMLSGAVEMAHRCGPSIEAARNPGVHLGALLGLAAEQGRDRLTFLADQGLEPLEDWIEQLVAESSGKKGKGILPITVEPLSAVPSYRPERVFAYLRRSGEHDSFVRDLSRAGHPVAVLEVGQGESGLGAEFFRWEMAIAVACHWLGISAFDQPDVRRAKDRTSDLLKAYRRQGTLPTPAILWQGEGTVLEGRAGALGDLSGATLPRVAQEVMERATESDTLVFLAYLPSEPDLETRFRDLRAAILDTRRLSTSRGYGPRYLHSTGQIHKGGPDRMVFVLLTADRGLGVAVPGMGVTFNVLQRAQAIGDLQALLALRRRAFLFHLESVDRVPLWFEAFQAACGRLAGNG